MENGESLTLQCSVQAFTSSCEEQSVYWFRLGSGESHPGIIYTHGNSSDECKKSSEDGSPPQSCVYTLPKRKLTTSDKGTLYCAVAACGQILFGNGVIPGEAPEKDQETTHRRTSKTRNSTSSGDKNSAGSGGNGEDHWIIPLAVSNIISVIVITVLVGVLYKNHRKDSSSSNHQIPTNQAADDDVLNYAAVSFAKKPSSSRTSREKSHEDVYAQVKIK
ncbi:hypothetical protein KOW79_019807 [Hemibagrus wyckioides]|uniref:Ig-like domain-containing protein n=1 Tax=Hemibagrus wyckioides TaxID=337641 RepID=A0A9D3S9E5_9TELE|nr:hypothetical protein KOW79_019807 [Hemibagrus wyckioides]